MLRQGDIIELKGSKWEIIRKINKPYSLCKIRNLDSETELVIPTLKLMEMLDIFKDV
jgi:NMD protein affecting ribosome stability and mRNA decay